MKAKLIATRYRHDYCGDISLEYTDNKNPFEDLAKDCGIDLTNQFLLGITFNKNISIQTITFIVTDIGKTYNEIQNFLLTNDFIPCKSFVFDMNINEFFKYTKRFSFMYSFNKKLIGQNIDIIEEQSL